MATVSSILSNYRRIKMCTVLGDSSTSSQMEWLQLSVFPAIGAWNLSVKSGYIDLAIIIISDYLQFPFGTTGLDSLPGPPFSLAQTDRAKLQLNDFVRRIVFRFVG